MSDSLAVLSDPTIGSTVACLLGLLWGSFFNVCIARIPVGESVVRHRSRCPRCAQVIAWYDNIPVLSWLFLRARCRRCRQPISVQYPLVELTTGVLFLLLFQRYGWTLELIAYAIFVSDLLVLSVIDLYHRIIPDELSLGGLVLGLLACFLLPDGPTWKSAFLGAFLGGGVFFAIAFLYEKWKGVEGLGGGDVKLLAMIGAWLGYRSLLVVIVLSSLFGTLVGLAVMLRQRRGLRTTIPFGPFLAVAALTYLWFEPELTALLFPDVP